jgi:hypothetical protein
MDRACAPVTTQLSVLLSPTITAIGEAVKLTIAVDMLVPSDVVAALSPPEPPTLPSKSDGAPPLTALFSSGVRMQAVNDTATAMVSNRYWYLTC